MTIDHADALRFAKVADVGVSEIPNDGKYPAHVKNLARAYLDLVEWRTMDSAPRDGNVFLAVNMRGNANNRFELCFSEEGMTWAHGAGWRNPGRDWSAYPTHWLPLPPPPKVTT